MKGKTTQPTRISEDEYAKFKQFVQDTHGTTRGHLKTEIENALREYRKPENQKDAIARIEDDVATIKATLAVAEADGGSVVDTPRDEIHTHAPQSDTTTKPPANAATDKKVAYLAERVREETDISADTASALPRSMLADIVKDEYGFRSDTAKRYVETLIEEFGLRPHPDDSYNLLVTEAREREILDERREQAREQSDAELENL